MVSSQPFGQSMYLLADVLGNPSCARLDPQAVVSLSTCALERQLVRDFISRGVLDLEGQRTGQRVLRGFSQLATVELHSTMSCCRRTQSHPLLASRSPLTL